MDATIITAIINSIAGLAIGALGLRAGVARTQGSQAHEIRQKQLDELLTPLQKFLFYDPELESTDSITKIRTLTENCFEIIPPLLLTALEPFLANDTLPNASAKQLKPIVSSFYNWTRRSLGYPYNRRMIKANAVPHTERNSLIEAIAYLALLCIWLFCAAALAAFNKDEALKASYPPIIVSSVSTLFSVGTAWSLISAWSIITKFVDKRKR